MCTVCRQKVFKKWHASTETKTCLQYLQKQYLEMCPSTDFLTVFLFSKWVLSPPSSLFTSAYLMAWVAPPPSCNSHSSTDHHLFLYTAHVRHSTMLKMASGSHFHYNILNHDIPLLQWDNYFILLVLDSWGIIRSVMSYCILYKCTSGVVVVQKRKCKYVFVRGSEVVRTVPPKQQGSMWGLYVLSSLHGCSPCSPASSHSPKTVRLGYLTTLNCDC